MLRFHKFTIGHAWCAGNRARTVHVLRASWGVALTAADLVAVARVTSCRKSDYGDPDKKEDFEYLIRCVTARRCREMPVASPLTASAGAQAVALPPSS